MSAIEDRVRQTLENIAQRYRGDGFTVERTAHLADDLDVDVIARRGSETILIEAKVTGAEAGSVKLKRLAEHAETNGWKFIVAVINSRDVEEVEIKTAAEIAAKLTEARQLGRASTAFPLLAWSVFEAAARNALARSNQRFTGAMPPRSLVQQLASLGLIDPDEESELMALAELRNRMAHGFWPAPPPVEGQLSDFERVLSLAERLVAADETQTQTKAG